MNASSRDPFGARAVLATASGPVHIHRLDALAKQLSVSLEKLPFSIRVMLEAALRNCDGYQVTQDDVKRLANWQAQPTEVVELPFKPARVILQDFTGVPCVVDLAAMREAVKRLGADPKRINPLVPVDLVIDHSVQVDYFGNGMALERNAELEFSRNKERYEFLRWGQKSFSNFRVVPPATGIVHQVNLEYLARGVLLGKDGADVTAYPDTLVGTDSHTTMITGLGVVGWGVGGIEAEAVMLGQPLYLVTPQVVGFKLTGRLRDGVTATDLVLTVTQMLRKKGVVDKFVEFYGPGLSAMSLPDRATIANMAPEYGATIGFFPVDAETLRFLERTGRGDAAQLTEAYCKEQGLFRTDASSEPTFSDTLALDLGEVEACLAGPKRPQDRVVLTDMQSNFKKGLTAPVKERGYGLDESELGRTATMADAGATLGHGAVVIAAITSCTNTSNPSVMLGAGLLARKAVAKGLKVQPFVKTSMAPGSKVVTEYLEASGTMADLDALGFNVVGYGCTSCIAEGTPVQMGDGLARPIESLADTIGGTVYGPSADRRLQRAAQVAHLDQGVKECVTLVLQDGRELVCTPDHRIMRADGVWVRADELVIGRDRVLMGLDAPIDRPGDDEAGYVLQAGAYRFDLSQPAQRRQALAFARVLGHLLNDGSISENGQGRMNAGQALDREAMLADIELLTGRRPVASRYDDRKWAVVLPKPLTEAFLALEGVSACRRIHQPHQLPAFVLAADCPLAIIREFLGGMFGADGHAPFLQRNGAKPGDLSFSHVAFSRSATTPHVASLVAMMDDVARLLERCGVATQGHHVYQYPTRRSATTYPQALDGEPRIEVRFVVPDGLSFMDRVGFRYCVEKAMRGSSAAVYRRAVQAIGEQRVRMAARISSLHAEDPTLSFSQARALAATALLEAETPVHAHYSLLEGHDRFTRLPQGDGRDFRPLHRDSAAFPSPHDLLTQMGVRDWFGGAVSSNLSDLVEDKRYCVDKELLSLPTYSLAVIDRRAAGTRHVYDLTVEGLHAFVANGVCVHNCIGNSGPLPEAVAKAVEDGKLVAAAVLSGNRNFEGRVNPLTRANYLASPPLVVAYALAGTVDIDFETQPLGRGSDDRPVYLKDIWPTQQEIADTIASSLRPEMFATSYGNVFDGNPKWNAIPVAEGELYAWDEKSTYIHEPPFFQNLTLDPQPLTDITGARVLVMVADSVTTDHISPAGDIALASPAGKWLGERGIEKRDFNSYGSRRGHDQVMVRGTFANIRLKNLLVPGSEGNITLHLPSNAQMPIHDASEKYRAAGTPLVVLAGKEYGTGSSRDWAAKGTLMLGVRAVLAESFERIHRSNLVGMGILPLVYEVGQSAESLGLTGRESFGIIGLTGTLTPRQKVTVRAKREDGSVLEFACIARLDTPVDVDYYKNGGILQTVLRNLAKS